MPPTDERFRLPGVPGRPSGQERVLKRFRFSIASLLILVLFVAVAVAALRASTDAWDISVFGLTLLMFLTSVLLAVHRTDLRRPYWLGFALFGWAYLVASLVPTVEARLPTTKGLAFLDSMVTGRVRISQTVAFSPQGNTLHATLQGNVQLWDVATGKRLAVLGGKTENFTRIGHSLLTFLMAFAGATRLTTCTAGTVDDEVAIPSLHPEFRLSRGVDERENRLSQAALLIPSHE